MTNSIHATFRNVSEQLVALREHICTLTELVESKLEEDQLSDKLKLQVGQILGTIQQDARKVLDLKLADSFFTSIIEKAPEAQPRVEQLEREHVDLLVQLDEIADDLVETSHALATRAKLHSWLERFTLLDQREAELLQKIWTVDIGSKD